MTIDELKDRHAKELAEAEKRLAIIESLGLKPGASVPVVSNIDSKSLDAAAWVSFSGPAYDPDKTYDPVAVVESLEAAGWTICPASLCKWDNYRPSPECGLTDSIPDNKPGCFGSTYKLTWVEPIAPVWVKPCQFSQCSIEFYATKDGTILKFSVTVPGLASIYAERVERLGDWHYERGSARVRFPQQWHSLEHCTVHKATKACVDTEKGISGAVYFQPHGEQTEWPLTASAFLRELIAAK